ncbi:hypothetical protein RSAG8_08271, partial [Rhizoctonia solani AG-8 WAC10335]
MGGTRLGAEELVFANADKDVNGALLCWGIMKGLGFFVATRADLALQTRHN